MVLALMAGGAAVPTSSPTGAAASAQPARCLGLPATIVVERAGLVTFGTSGPDVVLGTIGADDIRGLGGRDRICGRGGSDVIRGNRGSDIIHGGSGHDKILGGPGDDQLQGGRGNDTLAGNKGDDRLSGGSGFDSCRPGTGDDAVSRCRVAAVETPEPTPTPQQDCHPSYDPCLRIVSDYDCVGGSGDGPYYTGRVRVIGPDVYRLDADGDGIGCE